MQIHLLCLASSFKEQFLTSDFEGIQAELHLMSVIIHRSCID